MAHKTYCNVCGRVIDRVNVGLGLGVVTTIGFGSKHDGDLLVLEMCSDCLDKIIDSCAISPLVLEEDIPEIG